MESFQRYYTCELWCFFLAKYQVDIINRVSRDTSDDTMIHESVKIYCFHLQYPVAMSATHFIKWEGLLCSSEYYDMFYKIYIFYVPINHFYLKLFFSLLSLYVELGWTALLSNQHCKFMFKINRAYCIS